MMDKIETLREQAKVLRTLAQSFNQKDIIDQLRELADRCDALAVEIETKLKNGV